MGSCPLKRSFRIFGCLQETTDGFILGDGCNQLKSAFTGLPEARTVYASCIKLQEGKSKMLHSS